MTNTGKTVILSPGRRHDIFDSFHPVDSRNCPSDIRRVITPTVVTYPPRRPIPSTQIVNGETTYASQEDEFRDVGYRRVRAERERVEYEQRVGPADFIPDYYRNYQGEPVGDESEPADMTRYVLELLQTHEYTLRKLEKLDPSRKKDSQKIVELKHRLVMIEDELDSLEQEGVSIPHKYRKISLWSRFVNALRAAGRRICRFFSKNADIIKGILGIVVPVVSTVILIIRKPDTVPSN